MFCLFCCTYPNTSLFQTINYCLSLLSLSLKIDKLFTPSILEFQEFLTTTYNLLSLSHMFNVLKGFNPQSICVALKIRVHWSDTTLSKTYCLQSDHYCNHCCETRNLSSLLFCNSIGLVPSEISTYHGDI